MPALALCLHQNWPRAIELTRAFVRVQLRLFWAYGSHPVGSCREHCQIFLNRPPCCIKHPVEADSMYV